MLKRIFIFAALCLAVVGQDVADKKPSMSVRILPSEEIPRGTCQHPTSGYLGDFQTGRTTSLSKAEIGEYVLSMISQGYVLTLYPQPRQRIFVFADCHPAHESTVVPSR